MRLTSILLFLVLLPSIESAARAQRAGSWADISARSPAGQRAYYEGSANYFANEAAKSNPYLAERIRRYFLATPATYALCMDVLRRMNDPSEQVDSVVEHLASDEFGTIFGSAMYLSNNDAETSTSLEKDNATLTAAGIKEKALTPIAYLTEDNKTLSDGGKVLVYEETAKILLSNLQKFEPALVSTYYDYLYVKPENGGDPPGYVTYNGVIAMQASKPNAAATLRTISAYSVLRAVIQTHNEALQKAKAAPSPLQK